MQISPSPIQTPKQIRSKKTMDDILESAAKILEEKNFDELTIAEVVDKANTSVGAFYGRFKDKNALLQALDESFFKNFEEHFNKLLMSTRWHEKSTEHMIEDVTSFIVEMYSKNRGVLRSLNLKARLQNDTRFREREKKAWDELFPRFQNALLKNKIEINHPDPKSAIHLGFQFMFFSAREIILWDSLRTRIAVPVDVLIKELSRAYCSYLLISGIEEE